MNKEAGLWLALCAFVVFCAVLGLLLGFLAYGLVGRVFTGA
ncbi:hypothetical protein [Cryptosporangium phraense]|nr:hypothetical protein [Cryptosporangium phraense]